MKNPGALAGATGAEYEVSDFRTADYRRRVEHASALRLAMEYCHPEDAALVMSDALERMRKGAPIPPLMNAMEEARDWAATATPFERKAWLLACFDAISPKDQAGFLAYVSRRASA